MTNPAFKTLPIPQIFSKHQIDFTERLKQYMNKGHFMYMYRITDREPSDIF